MASLKRKRIYLIALSASFFLATTVLGDSPSDFFEKGFAGKPGDDGTPRPSEVPTQESPSITPQNEVTGPVSPDGQNKKSSDDVLGISVRGVGAVLDASDESVFFKNINEIADAAISHNLPVSKIYAIGTPERIIQALKKLMQIDPSGRKYFEVSEWVQGALEPPAEYNVSRSPTWILETDDGQIVLEAVGNIDRFVNRKNIFVDRS